MLRKSKKNPKTRTSRIVLTKPARRKAGKTAPRSRVNAGKPTSRIILKITVFLFLIVIIFSLCTILSLPKIKQGKAFIRQPLITILDRDGAQIGQYGDRIEAPVEYDDLPQHLIQALITAEDKRFYYHFGIDPIAIIRALITNFQTSRKSSGASTITQQLAKNLFLTSEKSYKRKVQEFYLAMWLEILFTKEQILTLYFNRSYFGSGVYGIRGAAKFYYDKQPEDLTLHESVSLITALKSPSRSNPLTRSENTLKRIDSIISAMNYDPAKVKKSQAIYRSKTFAMYFNDWILEQTVSHIGTITQDIIIHTTLDSRLQRIAEQKVKLAKNHQAAIILADYNGGIRAMVGGKDYKQSQFNRSTQALRQTGSLIKPFIYLLALEKGRHMNDYMYDEAFSINGWQPRNFSKNYYGNISLHDALVRSLNTIPVRLTHDIGVRNLQKHTKKFGLNTSCIDSPVIALGTCENTLLDLVSAYGTLASGGYNIYTHGIESITNSSNKTLYKRSTRDKKLLIKKDHLYQINAALSDVINKGTGKRASVEVLHIMGKTGTSQDYRDAYFIGFAQGLVGGIWIGNDDNSPMRGITGGQLPAEIFKEIFSTLAK